MFLNDQNSAVKHFAYDMFSWQLGVGWIIRPDEGNQHNELIRRGSNLIKILGAYLGTQLH
jgi:hypothetical protein